MIGIFYSILAFISSLFIPIEIHSINQNYNTIGEQIECIRIIDSITIKSEVEKQKIESIITKYNKTIPQEQIDRIANLIWEMTIKYPNLNTNIICALITHESAKTWDFNIRSKMGAIGLMQIMPSTGIFLLYETKLIERKKITYTKIEDILENPLYNIELGCHYLSCMINQFGVDGGLAAYNGGPRSGQNWCNNNLIDVKEETLKYVPFIKKLYSSYVMEFNTM